MAFLFKGLNQLITHHQENRNYLIIFHQIHFVKYPYIANHLEIDLNF